MGGQAPTQANNSNTSSSTNNIRDIGFTGQQGVNVLRNLGDDVRQALESLIGGTQGTLGGLTTTTGQTLNTLTGAATTIANEGFRLSDVVNSRTTQTLADLSRYQYQGLEAVVNAARDVSQRTIAAGIGQATPLQQIPAAGENRISPVIVIALVGLAIVALRK